MGLDRSQVFITNVVKCRPPNNRDPLPAELAACTPYLDRQIALLDPLILVTLGRYSLAHLLGAAVRITKLHGRPTPLGDRLLLPMFHPAAALRNPQWQQSPAGRFRPIARSARGSPPQPPRQYR